MPLRRNKKNHTSIPVYGMLVCKNGIMLLGLLFEGHRPFNQLGKEAGAQRDQFVIEVVEG